MCRGPRCAACSRSCRPPPGNDVSERRELRRRLGPVAWCALEDLTDDAEVDAAGRLVVRCSVRALAANLGVSKDTAARSVRRLTRLGLVVPLPIARLEGGRFGTAAYAITTPCPTAPQPSQPLARPARRRPANAEPAQASLFDVRTDETESQPAGNPDDGERGSEDARCADGGDRRAETAGAGDREERR